MHYYKLNIKNDALLDVIVSNTQTKNARRRRMEIPIIPTTNTIGDYLSIFKHYFSQPQYRNFTHYILGLIMCEGKRTIL